MKKFLGHWNLFEIIWLVIFCIMAVVITIITKDNLFGFFVFLSGVLCVVLAAKGNIFNYLVGTLNTVGYAWLSWQNGLFGEVGLNLLFYLPMNIIGFFMWRKHLEESTVAMRKMNIRGIILVAVITVVSIAALGFGLSFIEMQNTPYIDATTNILSIAATLLMIRRYREQWALYIILNIFTVIMWSIRTANGSPNGPLMITMWSAYLINSCYGLYNWSKGANAAKEV